ncbi:hypothetical protein FQR65_LT00946 [Abscondita terminalis]|nr:hypothetical protein FQR65_LT00946 [Abscondita terminalis]
MVVAAEHVSYDGFKVYRIRAKTQKQLKLLVELNKNAHVDLWSPLRSNAHPTDVMIHPIHEQAYKLTLDLYGIQHEVLIENVEKMIKNERALQNQARSLRLKKKISFTQYNRFDQINAYLDHLARTYRCKVVTKVIGQSYNGRVLKVIQISTKPSAKKPIIFIDGGIHAREWISPAFVLYVINQLVENAENRNLLDKVDWHILPVMNPDGYEYTHTNDRLWRKTRSPQQNCIGTDPNRNFDYHWGEVGASSDPCDETYMGPYAFSEIETINVKTYVETLGSRVKLYLTFHSYGNYLLYPWGYTSALPSDEPELRSLARSVNSAIVQAGGDSYTIGTSTNVLYPAAGGSDDWAKGVARIQLSYTIELPGGGTYGFDPPANKIQPICRETFPGVKVYGKYIAEKFGN